MKNENRHISNVDYWQADILSAYDYSPFGVMLSGRTFEKEETVQVCHNETTLTTTPVLEEGFGSWFTWTTMGSALLTYVNGEMQVSNPSSSSNNIGASKTFTTGSGVHSVSFDIIDNTCATIVLWPPSVTPKTINVYIRDNANNIVASGAYTTAGNYSLSFTPATTGATYKIEFYMTSASAFCYYRIDDVLITYQSEEITQVCEQVSKKGSYRYGFNGQERDDQVSGNGNSYSAEFWQYSPRLGKRWNLDPKPNISISPYATFGNNPILYQDWKGDTLRIAGTKEQQMKTLYHLQTLTNDKLILKDNNVIIDWENSVNCGKKLENGTGLVRDLIKHDKTVTIYHTKGTNQNRGAPGEPQINESNGIGKNQRVFINFNQLSEHLTENPIDGKSIEMVSPIRITLAHELIHAFYGMEGTDSPIDKNDTYIYTGKDNKQYKITQPKRETDTVGLTGNRKYTENKIRKEQGMSKRVKY